MAWWTLYKREMAGYFQSVIAYVVLFGYALVESILFVILVSYIADNNYKDDSVMQIFFTWQFFWPLLFFLVPIITMRTFSEEFKLGTIEMLLTAPVSEWDVVAAKFLGSLTFFLIAWVPTALNLCILQICSSSPPPPIWSEIGLTTLTLTLVGAFYTSIGIFSSVLTRNQMVSAAISFTLLLVCLGLSMVAYLQKGTEVSHSFFTYISLVEHFRNAVQGVFDTRPIVFYIALTAFMLVLTQRILQARRLQA